MAPNPLNIFYPNGKVEANLCYIWVGGIAIPWDGSVSIGGIGTQAVEGILSNNTAAPGATNIGALTAIANAAAPSWTEGRQVLLSTDLAGNLRVAATISTAGLATEAKQDDIIAELVDINTALAAPLVVTATDLDIRNLVFATDKVDVSGSSSVGVTGTFFQATQPVSIAALPALPANQSVNLAQVAGATTLVGNGVAAGSLRVTLANDSTGVIATVSTVTTVTSITNPVGVIGTIADGSATPGNPVMIGGFMKWPDGTDPGSVTPEDDVVRFIADANRRQYVNTVHPRFGHKHLDGSSAYTDESVAADPGDGFQTIITNIIVGTNAATAMNFFLEEGSTKIFGPYGLEAVAGRGFASGPIHLPVTPSTAVTITTTASIAQGIDIDYFIQAVP